MPTDDEKATFTSDGNSQYIGAILKNFKRNTVNYGQIIKERVNGRVISKSLYRDSNADAFAISSASIRELFS